MSRSRLLFIDAYDSFSNNIISLLESELDVDVTKVRIDTKIDKLPAFLKPFAAVVAGPGPGTPENEKDIGLIADLWSLRDEDLLPVLGICLGFQSLVCAFGGQVERLSQPRHGIETLVTSNASSLFKGLPNLTSVQYHSLQARLNTHTRVCKETQGGKKDLRETRPSSLELIPLAWDFTPSGSTPDGRSSEGILMAVKHVSKPFHGIQFHPESICSSPSARNVVSNWWNLSMEWLRQHRPVTTSRAIPGSSSWLLQEENVVDLNLSSYGSSQSSSPSMSRLSPQSLSSRSSFSTSNEHTSSSIYQYECIALGELTIPKILDILKLSHSEIVVLDSEKRQIPKLGRHSILGFIDSNTLKLNYHNGTESVDLVVGDTVSTEELEGRGGVFQYLKTFLERRKIDHGVTDVPFWGGLMGYVTYEACLETIRVSSRQRSKGPDIGFAFVERSIVIDHINEKLYIQSIRADDLDWIRKMRNYLQASPILHSSNCAKLPDRRRHSTYQLPSESTYRHKINLCKEEIRAGNSYELCLTNQVSVASQTLAGKSSSWDKYLELRHINPAPFAAYARLGALTVLSSSPERFLSWTRPRPEGKGPDTVRDGPYASICQFRPIKGTVKKQRTLADGKTCLVSLEEATALLSTQKERAENLMIVDLIRHDLHGIVGSGNVRVSSLMAVEEYERVYQLVSVIEGTLLTSPNELRTSGNGAVPSSTGIDVLAASLPPGSMTGAPKKRSCELLQIIEDEPRSVYSGIIGYMCVGGSGDFSVVIRTIYKWDNEESHGVHDEWKIGAGGAITALSDEGDEWDEMLVKLKSTLGVFG